MNTREYLIENNVIVDNEYTNLYFEIVDKNRDRAIDRNITQRHHIIPKYFYRSIDIDVDDSDENTVNLIYRDHIMAHYYLYMCSASDYYRFCNVSAMKYLVGNNNMNKYLNTADVDKILNDIDYYQEIYEEYKKEKEKFISRKGVNCGKIWINNGKINKRVYIFELDDCIRNGFVRGVCRHTYEARCWISRNEEEMMICENRVNDYLNDGWILGRSCSVKESISKSNTGRVSKPTTENTIGVTDGKTNRFIKIEHVDKFLEDNKDFYRGITCHREYKSPSSEVREKIKNSQKMLVWINKDGKNKKVNSSVIDNYISDGYSVGRYIEDRSIFRSKNGMCWVNMDGDNKFISISELNSYLSNGWNRGRNMSKIVEKRNVQRRKKV